MTMREWEKQEYDIIAEEKKREREEKEHPAWRFHRPAEASMAMAKQKPSRCTDNTIRPEMDTHDGTARCPHCMALLAITPETHIVWYTCSECEYQYGEAR